MAKVWAALFVTAAVLAMLTAGPAPNATAQIATRPAYKGHCGATWPAYPFVQSPMRGNCPATGSRGYVLHITWSAGPDPASLQVRGFDENGHQKWYNCGSLGQDCPVPWGNQLATPEFRAQALSHPTTVAVQYN